MDTSNENSINSQLINDLDKMKLKKSETVDLGDIKGNKKKKRIEVEYEGQVPTKHLGKNHKKFKEFYDLINEMRKARDAPVDKMGAFSNPDKDAPRETQKF